MATSDLLSDKGGLLDIKKLGKELQDPKWKVSLACALAIPLSWLGVKREHDVTMKCAHSDTCKCKYLLLYKYTYMLF